MVEHPIARQALIIGAGPAGLTAAYELLQRTDVVPLVFEASDAIGGISQTANYKGNRLDLGGHRFFSKSDRVMQWWLERLPRETSAPRERQAEGPQAPDLRARFLKPPTASCSYEAARAGSTS